MLHFTGDLERKLKIPISAFCDRYTTIIPKSQSGIIIHAIRCAPTSQSGAQDPRPNQVHRTHILIRCTHCNPHVPIRCIPIRCTGPTSQSGAHTVVPCPNQVQWPCHVVLSASPNSQDFSSLLLSLCSKSGPHCSTQSSPISSVITS